MFVCPVCKKECSNFDALIACATAHKKAEEDQKRQLLKAEQDNRLKEVNDAYDVATKAYQDANAIAQKYMKDYPNAKLSKYIELPFGRLIYSDGFSLDNLFRDLRSAFDYTGKAGF